MEDIDYTESPVFSSQLLPPLVGADVFSAFVTVSSTRFARVSGFLELVIHSRMAFL